MSYTAFGSGVRAAKSCYEARQTCEAEGKSLRSCTTVGLFPDPVSGNAVVFECGAGLGAMTNVAKIACEAAGGTWDGSGCFFAPPPEPEPAQPPICEFDPMVEYPMPPAPECNCPAGTFYEELDNTFRCSVAPEPPETPVEPDPSQPSPQPSKAPSGNNMDTIIVAGAAAAVAAILIVSLIGKKG